MKISLINSYDYGGAGKSCIRLHLGLLNEGLDSSLLLKKRTIFTIDSKLLIPRLSYQNRLIKKIRNIGVSIGLIKSNKYWREADFIRNRPKGLEYFSFPYSDTDITQNDLYKSADIANLHWVADFLDWKSFFENNSMPLVWTLHDQNPFLGGEHYSEKFSGMDVSGHPVSRVYTEMEKQEEKKQINLKLKCLKNISNLHIVSPSKWLLELSQKSELFKKYPHYHIPYGYPTDIFKQYEQGFCREVLGIPKEKKVLLFVAESLNNNRKGFCYLEKALEILRNENRNEFILCSIGSRTSFSSSEKVIHLGPIFDERLMAIAYNAADLFIIPSLIDNLPNTMVESILCGTPVVGFKVGGIPEVVIDYETGLLCPQISAYSLKETIEKFFENPFIFDREKIAFEAKRKFDMSIQAKAYISLYRSILSKQKN